MSQLTDKEIDEVLFHVPSHASDYATYPGDLDVEDRVVDAVPKLKTLMHEGNEYYAMRAAMILTAWEDDEGFDYLERFVFEHPVLDGWMEHRLRGYDDTYLHILSSFKSYWARRSDAGHQDEARHKIFRPVSKIIEYANTQPFEISGFFWIVGDERYTEYIPLLKQHLEAIAQNPRLHHWKIVDCAKLLKEFDPEFVQGVFEKNHLNPADFQESS